MLTRSTPLQDGGLEDGCLSRRSASVGEQRTRMLGVTTILHQGCPFLKERKAFYVLLGNDGQ
ncbi:hypothetical protein SLEP1_g51757 [Rubroshorea leprosula]|uniref:Uncharacterized protein n=1 Tax=Rubroshorea leprosula TaxID=152421 RepID=A0AAV5M504_9ROSI|nr:hypothetical protein SLEP1_g51757 [Rubroshorea leprosula]